MNFVKFLVIGKAIEYGGPINPSDFIMFAEKIALPSVEMFVDWEKQNKVLGGLFAGQRAGVAIMEASSGEELSSLLQQLPFWAQNTWDVIPLQSFESGVKDAKMQIEKAKKMTEMMGKPM